MDVKVFNESGHGYWLEGFGCIRDGGGFNDANTGHAILILNDQGGSCMDVSDKAMTLRAQEHGHQPIICLAFDAYNMADTGEVAKTLNSAATDTDHIPVICLQANCIDRADTARENGCGWSEEGVSYTLNIIDRHAICYEEHTQGKVATMSHDLFSTRFGEDGKANTLAATDYKEPPIVCYAVDQQGGKGGANWLKDKMCTLCSDSHGTPHAVCYAVENHPNDSRLKIDDDGIVQTLSSRTGTGGGNTPLVLLRKNDENISEENRKSVCE